MGGDLVKIDSLREDTYVTYLARTFSYKSVYLWIGLHRGEMFFVYAYVNKFVLVHIAYYIPYT